MTWAPDMDTPRNAEFVDAYIAKFGKVPGSYAMQAYDTAILLDSAIEAAGGNGRPGGAARGDQGRGLPVPARRLRLQQEPVPDPGTFYLVEVAQRADGMFQTQIVEQVFDDYGDVYADACTMGG